MGILKEKSSYRPSPLETALAWVVTAASGIVAAWKILAAWLGGGSA